MIKMSGSRYARDPVEGRIEELRIEGNDVQTVYYTVKAELGIVGGTCQGAAKLTELWEKLNKR